MSVKVEYGQPIVSINGDIYCWRRTPETYSILKWTWRDSLDSPANLKINISGNMLSLTWEAPEEDAAIVKEYEITRSTDLCGPFEPIVKVKKGVLVYDVKKVNVGESYYYKVRAIKDDNSYSGFSNMVVNGIP